MLITRKRMISRQTIPKRFLWPGPVLPEVSYLLRRDLGYANSLNFFEFFESNNVRLVPVLKEDLARVYEVAQFYVSARFDLVDCCIMAITERLNVTRIETFDRRDFSIFRPRHCDFFELLP